MIKKIVAFSASALFIAVQCDQLPIPVDETTITTILTNTEKLIDKCNCPDDSIPDITVSPQDPPPPPAMVMTVSFTARH